MSFVLTIVASSPDQPIRPPHADKIQSILNNENIGLSCKPVWLEKNKALDLGLIDKPNKDCMDRLRSTLNDDKIDVFISSIDNRVKKLLIADMDSTIVKGETLDELSEYAGVKEQVAAITARTMNGEIGFTDAIRDRVKLLKGLPIDTLNKTLETIEINTGALSLVRTMKQNGATCILVSGGFTVFTGPIAAKIGFHEHHGNELVLDEKNNEITGRVADPILDKQTKVHFLQKYSTIMKLKPEQTMSIGDGANDIPMLKLAGLGIGYKPKPAVREEIENIIQHGDLTAALYAQGFTKNRIIAA